MKNESPNLKERAADAVSKFGGSWTFILLFVGLCAGWIAFNVWVHVFDPFPFILLNLCLSCLAVFQAPFILMSQNRASDIDRQRAEADYQVDLENKKILEDLQVMLNIIIIKLDSIK